MAAQAALHGYTAAFWAGAGAFAVAIIGAALLLRSGVPDLGDSDMPAVGL